MSTRRESSSAGASLEGGASLGHSASRRSLHSASANTLLDESAGGKAIVAGSSSSAATGTHDGDPLPLWALGLAEELENESGWWPEALDAVEDGARLNIYSGSVLDGRWLDSLDCRLSSTMRAMRR